MKRRIISIACILVVLVIYVFLVWRVNASAETVQEQQYEMGSWLPIEDGYIIDETIEHNDGYSIRVDDAEVMSPSEFVAWYGKEGVPVQGLQGSDDTVLAVTMTIKNEGNTTGGFESFMWQVVPESRDNSYCVDEALFAYVEDTGLSFRIKTDTDVVLTPRAYQRRSILSNTYGTA